MRLAGGSLPPAHAPFASPYPELPRMRGPALRRHPLPAALALVATLALVPLPLAAQAATSTTVAARAGDSTAAAAPAARRVLTLADYGRWSRVTGAALSSDGRWMSFVYAPNDGDGTLTVRRLADTLRHVFPVGSGARFSDDARWVALFTSPAEKEAERLRKARRPVPRAVVLVELATGRRDSIPNATAFDFAETSRWVAVRRARTDTSSKHDGSDVVLRELAGGTTRHLGSVGQYAFNEQGTHLAYTVDAADMIGNGLYVLELASGRVAAVATGAARFSALAWHEDGTRLAALRGTAPEGQRHRANALLVVANAGSAAPTVVEQPAPPGRMVISENATPSWSDDGARVFVGVREQEPAAERGDDPRADVDVWHWNDEELQSVQKVRAERDRRLTYTAAFLVGERKLVTLATDSMRQVTPTRLGTVALGRDDSPYRGGVQWGGGRADWYAVNTATGARTLVARGVTRTMGTSPDGRWFLYLQDGRVMAHDLRDGRATNLSDVAGVDFVDREDDHPYERPVYGVAGWSRDGRSVLLNHRFDVWQLPLAGGKAVNLTRGAGDSAQIVFRVVRLGEDDVRRGIDMTRPLVFAATGEWTKQSGYWQRETNGRLRPLLYEDRRVAGLARAEHADRVIFTRQSFTEFPDWYTASGSLASPVQVTDANPQLAEYRWGSRVLVDFTNGKGQRLQGTLTLPAGYEPGKKYPMITYFYEKVSDRHHEFSMPVYDDRPHFSAYASDGYLVFMPDIVYEEGKPGSSALDAVTSGVKKVIELGYADPARIAIQGHSWGGYQGSFIITQTDMFRAAVIGAPPANLVSMYDQLYKNTGTVNHGIFEVGQVRMGDGATPWTAQALYESQSPVHQIRNVKTPFLILHGTDDGAVDWLQGVELFNAARRHGKEVILLSYPGENHHLAKKENTKDFQTRMKQYFDHYLKDAPAPAWMTDGVPHLRKGVEQP